MDTEGIPIEPDLQPVFQPEPTAQDFHAPDEVDPDVARDPMPDDLQLDDPADELKQFDPMEGEAPSG